MQRGQPYPKSAQVGRPRPVKRMAFGRTLAVSTEPMRPVSKTNSRAVAKATLYAPKRLAFLAAHPWCEMNIAGVCPRGRHEATEIQHMVQTSLDPSIENLLDETHWLASCHDANTWAGNHPQEAIALGVELDAKEHRHDRR